MCIENVKRTIINEAKGYDDKDARMQWPALAELEITSECNANCIFCPREQIPSPHHMSSDTWTQIINRLKESQIRSIKLAGFGEPTLHPNFKEILGDLRCNQFEVRLNTNLSYIHNLDIEYILSNCIEVIASIHTLEPDIYKKLVGRNFLKQVRNNLSQLIRLNKSYGRKVTVYIVLTHINPNAWKDFKPYLNQISLRLSGCSNRVVDDFPNYIIDLEANKKYNHYPIIDCDTPKCGFATAACVIDCDGNYLLCTNDIGRRSAVSNVWSNSVIDALINFQNRMMNGKMLKFCCKCENYKGFHDRLRLLSEKNHQDL